MDKAWGNYEHQILEVIENLADRKTRHAGIGATTFPAIVTWLR